MSEAPPAPGSENSRRAAAGAGGENSPSIAPATPARAGRPRPGPLLAIILVVSAVLRLALAWQGGQYYFGDEIRFDRGVAIYQDLRTADWAGLTEQLKQPDHIAFSYLAAMVAALQHGAAQFTPDGEWSDPQQVHATAQYSAAVLGLFSVLNLWLVYRLALASGAGDGEALWGALLAAASNSLFYYSRHLLPYDCALSAALGAIYFALTGRTRRRCAASGALAGLGFELYNGYWFLVPVVLFALGWATPPSARRRAAASWAGGFLGVLAVLLLPAIVLGGREFWTNLDTFQHSVLQGLFAEGWSLPAEYLWHAEGWLGLVVAAAAVQTLRHVRSGDPACARLRLWLLLLTASYLLPVLASVGLEKFVVYARTIRPVIPFFCLLGGLALQRFAAWRPRLGPAAAGLVVAGALAHFAPHYFRVFPHDIDSLARRLYGTTKRGVTFSGVIYYQPAEVVRRPDILVVNAVPLYPLREYLGAPAGAVLFSWDHPLAYLPYQYEGHTPRERALLRRHVPRMQIIRLATPAAVPDRPPASLLFGPSDLPDGRDRGRSQ